VCKKSIKNSQPFVRKNEKMPGPLGGGGIFDSHCTSMTLVLYVMAVAVVNNNMPPVCCSAAEFFTSFLICGCILTEFHPVLYCVEYATVRFVYTIFPVTSSRIYIYTWWHRKKGTYMRYITCMYVPVFLCYPLVHYLCCIFIIA